MNQNKTLQMTDFRDKKANFHTHTTRCKHAYGEDREYVEKAIEAGFEVLGFSDHVPQPFKDGYVSRIRMGMDELEGYVDSVLSLKEEYKKDIDLYLGFEAEYFPELFPELIEQLQQYPVDYMILGQHFLDNEVYRRYVGRDADEAALISYVKQVIEAIHTGYFSYVAHPDIISYSNYPAVYNQYMKQLCMETKKLGIPLEVNVNGYREGVQYPNEAFIQLGAETGNTFLVGVDAHHPDQFLDDKNYKECIALAKKYTNQIICCGK